MRHNELLARDAAARERALCTRDSFIVRAPAGSGKTELLIQRVLALLATADIPEEVVAITFTRKAAAEMKQRLINALAEARESAASELGHKRRTFELARAVCERDAQRGWNLVANPSRLRVQTIDALAQWLARHLPLVTGLGAVPVVTEDAGELYAAAARATLGVIDSRDHADRELVAQVERVLVHLDNDVGRAVELLSSMLARRDQWLRHLGGQERAELESAMQRACERQMKMVCMLMPPDFAAELAALARYAAGNGSAAGPLSPCADLTDLPEAEVERLNAWNALASLLLTKQGTWRARFTQSEGFPTGKAVGDKRQAKLYRERIVQLTAALAGHDELRDALLGLRALPPPRYSDAQWSVVEAILGTLRRAAAELAVVFAEHGTIDFAEVTRRAVTALGDERGSDLAMALDARIRHLLVDEFQDTSITQFELIERLVSEWQAGDGRTMLVVGDPMQSIYRFREAEVGLFLRAWKEGIGPVRLEPLQLARNFRSQSGIVDWVNESFARVLPADSDLATGAVSFEPAASVHGVTSTPAVVVHGLVQAGAADEAARVAAVVASIRAREPTASIALLVRARTHLVEIAVALRNAGLQPTAVELDVLATRPLIGDLLALTRALEHGGDRVAWLASLRAPWCGLMLADLSALAEGASAYTVPELLRSPNRLPRLSSDGAARLARAAAVLQRAMALRERVPTSRRVEEAWLLLGGPACAGSPTDRSDAEQFFDHLARHEAERSGQIDIALLTRSLQVLFAAPDPAADPAFHVMTIHKAKGLEFDHVIVPRLAAQPRRDDAQLMVWLEREAEAGPELLLAPIHAGGSDKDALVRWVEAQLRQRQRHEDERLAYVAATRARHSLHWVAGVLRDARGEVSVPDTSLLARLWPALGERFAETTQSVTPLPALMPAAGLDQSLRRLPAGWSVPVLPSAVAWHSSGAVPATGPAIEYSWAGETARLVGTVVHRWLQRMAEDGLSGWDERRVVAIAPQIERVLAAGGLSGDELVAARARSTLALTNVLLDERGRWVLGDHPQHHSELKLTVATGAVMRRLVLDRTFVAADGDRWIVDYKVGSHEGSDVRAFLDSEQQRYRSQLETYRDALDPGARLGLYFPLVPGWREWGPDDASG